MLITMEAPISRPQAPSVHVMAASAAAAPPAPSIQERQEAQVVKFASLLSTAPSANNNNNNSNKTDPSSTSSSSSSTSSSSRMKDLLSLISPQVSNQDIVLIVPSLDIQVPNESSGSAGPLPKVGETSHSASSASSSTIAQQQQQQQQPNMTASVLSSATTQDAATAHEEVVGAQTSWTKSTCSYASVAIETNISESFSRLVGSRMRAWTLLLLRHSLSTGDSGSRDRLLGILAASLKVKSTETRFRTLKLPASANDQPKDKDVILPLLFEATITIFGQDDKSEVIKLRAPGTISANFLQSGIKLVEIVLDGNALLTSMVERTRLLVIKAVASATKTQVPSTSNSVPSSSIPTAPSTSAASEEKASPAAAGATAPNQVATAANLSGFRTALTLSSPGLQKARTSALRLNSVLHGSSNINNSNNNKSSSSLSSEEDSNIGSSSLGMRKVRSVRWNTPGQIPSLATDSALAPAPKRSRRAQRAAKLKSFKSFGRPHGGDFGSGPRNATFGEYGGRVAVWGRDGKMAHHPMPMQQAATQQHVLFDAPPTAERNATFDLMGGGARQSSRGSGGGGGGANHLDLSSSMDGSSRGGGGGSSSSHFAGSQSSGTASMPRTATVLESLLLKNSMLKHSASLGKK